MKLIIRPVLLASIVAIVGATPALAYIDPNVGGMLFQMLAVVLASATAIMLFFSRQIRTFSARVLRGLRGKSGSEAESQETSSVQASGQIEPSGGDILDADTDSTSQ